MNRTRAQEILLRHRPGQTPADEETREALGLLSSDLELANWYREQEQFHAGFQAALGGIKPPTGLHEEILTRRKVIHPPWRQRSFIVAAVAAAVLLMAGLTFWPGWPREEASFAVFQSRMVGFATRQYRMDIETTDERAVRAHLQQKGSPASFPLPQELAMLPVKGGASLTWKSRPVSMVCFDWQGKETLYLFVIEQNQVEQASLPGNPDPEPYKTVGTAAWKSGAMIYLLVSSTGEETLESVL